MALAMGARRDPLMLIVTTAGVRTDTTGGDSIAYSLFQYGSRVARGEVDDPSFFMAWWEAEDAARSMTNGRGGGQPGARRHPRSR
jgi:phage terminase large subunit-like protein